MKETIGVRLDPDWLKQFRREHPNANISKTIRELLEKFYPMDSDKHSYYNQYRQRIIKNNELMAKRKELDAEYNNNLLEIELYEKKMKECKGELDE